VVAAFLTPPPSAPSTLSGGPTSWTATGTGTERNQWHSFLTAWQQTDGGTITRRFFFTEAYPAEIEDPIPDGCFRHHEDPPRQLHCTGSGAATTMTVNAGLGDDMFSCGLTTNLPGYDLRIVFHGGGGADWAWGCAEKDTLNGDAGDDTLYGSENDDVLSGGDGDDELVPAIGNDSVLGGSGSDYLSLTTYELGDRGASIDLRTGRAYSHTLRRSVAGWPPAYWVARLAAGRTAPS
jgi:Ca2+-binding RTX toxin-like protein